MNLRAYIASMTLALLTLVSAVAHADVSAANDLLSAWQIPEADRAIKKLEAKYPSSPEVLYLRARYDFFEGRYEEAVSRLDQAISVSPRADWQQLRDVIASTRDVVSKYEKHVSPKGYFEVWVEPGRDEVLLPYAFEALDAAYEGFGDEFGFRPETPIRVEVYPRTETLAAVSSLTEEEIRTSGTIALCKYNRLMITSPKALMRGYGWVDTLVHEYAHFVINRRTANRVPIWMHEGLAKFLERRWRGADAHRLAPSSEHLLQKRVRANDLITFEQMHPSMAKLPSQEDAAVAFAEVYTAMEYLREKAGKEAFKTLLDKIAAGTDARTAFASTLGTSFRNFERDWREELTRRPPIEYPEESGFQERLVFRDEDDKPTELSQIPQPKARDHIHLGGMLQARDRFGAAVVEYRKAERLMGAASPILQTRLAQSLNAIGEHAQAYEALVAIRDTFPGYVITWIEMGRAKIGTGEYEEAVKYLEEAARINPLDPSVHDEMARAYEKWGRPSMAEQARKLASLVK